MHPPEPTLRQRALHEVRALWRLAWPILVGQLATIGMSVTDVAMAGHASAQDLAGVSLGVSVYNILIITLMGLVLSVAPQVAQHMGAQDPGPIAHVVRQGLWKALGTGLLALCAALLSTLVFQAMDIEPGVRAVATGFVQVISAALPAFACWRVLYGYSTSINQTKPMMVIALLALLLNFAVNWLLVFGNAGFPALGGVGCAWSTLVCVWFSLGCMLLWMRVAAPYRSTWPFDRFERPHWPTLRGLLRLGLPIGVTYLAETSAFSLIAFLVARFGSTQIAAHQIALNFSSLTFMLPLSAGMAVLTRVGQSLGAQEPRTAAFRAWVGVALSVAIAVLAACVMAGLNHQIAGAYTSDLPSAELAAQLLVLAALFQLPDCMQTVTSGAIRGYKVSRAPMVLHLAAFWGVSLPLGCVLGLNPAWLGLGFAPLGAQGFWIGLILGLSVAAVGLLALLRSVSRERMQA